jgi:hypothetical protein
MEGRSMSPVAEFSPARARHRNHQSGDLASGLTGFMNEIPKRSPARAAAAARDDHLRLVLNHEDQLENDRAAASAAWAAARAFAEEEASRAEHVRAQSAVKPPLRAPPPPPPPPPNEASPLGRAKAPHRRGFIESAGGLAGFEMTNAPVLPIKGTGGAHAEGSLESTKGGIFAYLASLEPTQPFDIPPAGGAGASAERKRIRFQDGELARSGIGNFIDPSSPPTGGGKGLDHNHDHGDSNSKNSKGSPTRARGTGAFDAFGVGDGLYKFVSDKGDPPKPHHRVPGNLETIIGSKHPGVIGALAPEPVKHGSPEFPHMRILAASHRGEIASAGSLAAHVMTRGDGGDGSGGAHGGLGGAGGGLARSYARVDGGAGTTDTLADPIYHRSALGSKEGGIGAFIEDPTAQDTIGDDYLPLFPGDKMPKRRPATVVDKKDYASDAVRGLMQEEEEEEAIARDLRELDLRLGRAGLPSASGGSAGAAWSPSQSGGHASPRRPGSARWHEGGAPLMHTRIGQASPQAAAIAASGKVPLDAARLARLRTAIRATLPKDLSAARVALRHKFHIRDGDGDGVLSDEELLRTLIDMSPSSVSASDVGFMARYLRLMRGRRETEADAEADFARMDGGGEEGGRGLGVGGDGASTSVPVLRPARRRPTLEEEWGAGVHADDAADWLLGVDGGRPHGAPGHASRSTGVGAALAHDDNEGKGGKDGEGDGEGADGEEEEGSAASSSSRFDFASKSAAYAAFRAQWEARHGAAAKKEAELDAAVPVDGPTWTRADPKAFHVIRVAGGAPPAPAAARAVAAMKKGR